MPIYQYRCKTCQKIIEVKEEISAAPAEHCQDLVDCQDNSEVYRIISNRQFILKGSGWFKDGYSKGDTNA